MAFREACPSLRDTDLLVAVNLSSTEPSPCGGSSITKPTKGPVKYRFSESALNFLSGSKIQPNQPSPDLLLELSYVFTWEIFHPLYLLVN
jgi:hypothetical protein